ncbi:GNAT family N-acetyltransferase [Streptomyces kanasensis]|uniref:GNAT family N-acetyltransferase n=1 Tax=Streptomyces kanasensis TaxID=936756 RepID=UPI00370175BD
MTTTLRPVGPLQQAGDGTRSRAYEVCVNSRPVGGVRIATVRTADGAVGTISDLRVAEADRGRGRGTVAALAAEEVLRGWDCERIRVSVPADAAPARRLAAALGYTESGHLLLKELDPAAPRPPAPAGLEVRPMTAAEFTPWRSAVPGRRELLPDDPATGGARVDLALRDGVPVGHLWTGWRDLPAGERVPYVWELEVTATERGKGYGRALMRCAEAAVRDAGGHRLALRVDPANAPARALYDSLGYRPLAVDYEKRLY